MAPDVDGGEHVTRRRARTNPLVWLLGPLVLAVAVLGGGDEPVGAAPVPGSQGIDTSLPLTESAVTVSGRGRFADLKITVNQTSELVNQAVSITWTGGEPTRQGPSVFASRYLQIFQCWGDDDGTVAANPGPPPEQCVMGAVGGTPAGPPGTLYPNPFMAGRIISVGTWDNFDPADGVHDPRTDYLWKPFRAVDGVETAVQFDPEFDINNPTSQYWQNPYFNAITTNELVAAKTAKDGRGAELFQVLTGMQSTGLGCGQKVQRLADGTRKIPACWLVVVPRGTPADENVGTPFEANANQFGVSTSPLSPAAWANRIAIPLDFKPLDSPCSLSGVERRIVGNEAAIAAVSSWQPALCATGGLPPFSYATVGDSTARQIMSTTPAGAPGMVVVSRPLAPTAVPQNSPVVYAPLSVSGLVIGFNIERSPTFDAPAAQQDLTGVRVAELNLTPRLLAKLLTQSYQNQVRINSGNPGYEWLQKNPYDLNTDPDFLQWNPEFALLYSANGRTFSGLQLPNGTSDAAQQLWEYVLADPEAKAWLDGQPDDWGMKVNPVYSTNPAVHPTGIGFATSAPNSFPKSEPYCYQAAPRGLNNSIVPPPLCGTDWLPYNRGYLDAARITRQAFDGARIAENPNALSSAQVWAVEGPQQLGRRAILSVTDTTSANLFGVQMARLSRAGDNRADRRFIAATTASLNAGVELMVPGADSRVLVPDPAETSDTAYPLTMVTYAAIRPLVLDTAARADYAAFLDFVAGPGQTSGTGIGELPVGYTPLPAALRTQLTGAAEQVRTMTPPAGTVSTTTTSTTVANQPAANTPGAASSPAAAGATSNGSTSGGATSSGVTPSARPASNSSSRPTTAGATASEETSDSSVPESVPPTSIEETSETAPATTVPTDAVTATTLEPAVALTPRSEIGWSRLLVAGLAVLVLVAALVALEITKRTRRVPADSIDVVPDLDGSEPLELAPAEAVAPNPVATAGDTWDSLALDPVSPRVDRALITVDGA